MTSVGRSMGRAPTAQRHPLAVARWATTLCMLARGSLTRPARAQTPVREPPAVLDSVASPAAALGEARKLLLEGGWLAAESLAEARMSQPLAPARADSLRRMDWLDILVEARLRAGRGAEDATQALATSLAI